MGGTHEAGSGRAGYSNKMTLLIETGKYGSEGGEILNLGEATGKLLEALRFAVFAGGFSNVASDIPTVTALYESDPTLGNRSVLTITAKRKTRLHESQASDVF